MKGKRIAAALIALLVACAATPALAASYHSEVRVLLSVGSQSALSFTPVGEYRLLEAPEVDVGNDELTLEAVGGRVSLAVDGKTLVFASLTFVSGDYGGKSAYIRLANSEHGTCTYLGNMTFDVKNGSIRAINMLPIDQYLYGVVPNEMSNSFPLEALMAQAVCARSYAMAKCSRYAARDYDLGDTSKDQVYCGYASKNTRAIAAVDATAMRVLTYEGDIIEAFYTSSNGGQTERSSNAWSEDYPYYINQDDLYDLANPSSMEYTAFIPALYTDETIRAMDRDVYAALLRGAYEAAGGEVQLLTTVQVCAYASDYEAPSRCFTLADVTLTVKKSGGDTGQLTLTLILGDYVYDSAKNTLGEIGARTYTLRMRGAERATRVLGGASYEGWNLTMRRYGHGVGLSQRGAQQRARVGQSYEEILAFYYAGAVLNTIGTWETAPRIASDRYRVKPWGVSGVEPGTVPSKLISKLTCEGELSVVTANGELKIESLVTTGNFVRVSYEGGACLFDLPIVIYGDLDGEGGITRADAQVLAEHLMRARTLTGTYLEAADVNHDGAVDAEDLVLLLRSLNGDEAISQQG
ncbi:MAG TPA: SpoIID/LytB domain-containing protein [Clostridia bacterium]|nr:SpoIID/LytB domain-containing protein [Clostridia bacterium]